jgi:hypothetical protein
MATIIGTNTKPEIEALEKEIATKCEGVFDATVHKLRKPTLIFTQSQNTFS